MVRAQSWMICDNTDTFFASGKKLIQFIDQYCQSIKEYVLQVQKSLHKMFVSIYLSSNIVCQVDLTSPHITFLASIFTPFQPSNNLPQTMAVNAKEADKEKQGPIYQHRSDSSSFIGDKKRTAVHLSFAETGKTGICAQRSPLDHSLAKKNVRKSRALSRAVQSCQPGPKTPGSQPNQSSSCNFLKTSPSYNCAMRH